MTTYFNIITKIIGNEWMNSKTKAAKGILYYAWVYQFSLVYLKIKSGSGLFSIW